MFFWYLYEAYVKVVKYDFFFFLLREASLIHLSLRGLSCQDCTWNDMRICFSCRVEGKSETPTARKVNCTRISCFSVRKIHILKFISRFLCVTAWLIRGEGLGRSSHECDEVFLSWVPIVFYQKCAIFVIFYRRVAANILFVTQI